MKHGDYGSTRTMSDILALPDEERQFLVWVLRRGSVGESDLQASRRLEKGDVPAMLARLEEMGFLSRMQDGGEVRYSVTLSARKERSVSIDPCGALGDQGGVRQATDETDTKS